MSNSPRFQQLYATIWYDQTIKKLSPSLFRLYIYCLSSPHSNLIGCYHLPLDYAMADLGYESKEKQKLIGDLGKLIEAGLISYDYEAECVLNKRHLLENKIVNANQAKGAVKVVERLGNTALLSELLGIVEKGPEFGYMKQEEAKLISIAIKMQIVLWRGPEALSKPLRTPSGISISKQEKDIEEGGYGGKQIPPLSSPDGDDDRLSSRLLEDEKTTFPLKSSETNEDQAPEEKEVPPLLEPPW